jgi:RimJ/RimL family protein N-acetyltransferase
MTVFSRAIEAYWRESFAGELLFDSDSLTVTANPELEHSRRLMLLETVDGRVSVVMTPELADAVVLPQERTLTVALLRRTLEQAGFRLHGADSLFYFPTSALDALRREATADRVRKLDAVDVAAFDEFQAGASEQDLDDAYVELDHWAVFGAFEQSRLVCAASMYPWDDRQIADVGVLTLPSSRGRGHARAVVRAISSHAVAQGHEPQYRCQLDNAASARLARSAGLSLFGRWDVISTDRVE